MPDMTRSQALAILRLPDTATDEQIKKAYRKQAKIYHPDLNKNAGAKEEYDKVVEAEKILLPPELTTLAEFVGGGAKFKLGGHNSFANTRSREDRTAKIEEEASKITEIPMQDTAVEEKTSESSMKATTDSWSLWNNPISNFISSFIPGTTQNPHDEN